MWHEDSHLQKVICWQIWWKYSVANKFRVPNADWKSIRFVATCSKHDCGAGDCWYDRVDSQGRKDIPAIGYCEAIQSRFRLRAKFTVAGCNGWEDFASPQLILNLSAGIVYLYVRPTRLLLLVNETLIIHKSYLSSSGSFKIIRANTYSFITRQLKWTFIWEFVANMRRAVC